MTRKSGDSYLNKFSFSFCLLSILLCVSFSFNFSLSLFLLFYSCGVTFALETSLTSWFMDGQKDHHLEFVCFLLQEHKSSLLCLFYFPLFWEINFNFHSLLVSRYSFSLRWLFILMFKFYVERDVVEEL
jgi:hypothetical protein